MSADDHDLLRLLPRLTPLFGFHPFGADTTCAKIHPHGPMPATTDCVCMACHRTSPDHEERIRVLAREAELRAARERMAQERELYRRIRAQKFARLRKFGRKGG